MSERSSRRGGAPIHEAMTMTDVAEPSDRQDGATPPAGPGVIDGSDLAFDDTMAELTLDDVSVVTVGDRPVLVPLSAELAARTGFTVLTVDDEVLLGLGVLPRRPLAPLLPLVTLVAAQPAVSEASTPSPVPVISASPFGPSTATPASPNGEAGATVETARPINAMAASHLDWETEKLGWPYVDRRADDESSGPELRPVGVPRSLAAGRPVNGVEALDLVVRGSVGTNSVIVDLQEIGSAAVAPVTMQIHSGSIVVLSGGRGSGKTSLLRLMASYDAPTSGRGVVDAEDLASVADADRAAREAIGAGFIPTITFLVPDLTVAENVELPLLLDDVRPAMARGAAEEALRRVGLGPSIGLCASVLSHAEWRLASVARALVTGPEIVFADEPFAGLGDADASLVLRLLTELVDDGGTVIMSCTDPRVRLAGVRQITMSGGAVVTDEMASATS